MKHQQAECPHCTGVLKYEANRGGEIMNCPVCREPVQLPARPPIALPPAPLATFPTGNVCIVLSVILTLLAWNSNGLLADSLILAYFAFALLLLGLTLRIEAAIRDAS